MHISEIHIYPVKSLGGMSLQSALLTLAGFQFDRQWMVVRPDGTFMTQRNFPQMSLIKTAIVDDVLVLSTFGMEAHVVKPVGDNAGRINTEVWGDQVSALEYDPITNEWLSQALVFTCQLVSFPADQIRQCNQKFANPGEHTKFADGFRFGCVVGRCKGKHKKIYTMLILDTEIPSCAPSLCAALK